MDMDVNTAIDFCRDIKSVSQKLEILKQLGLGYLTLGEETPGLSGGEAQRLKLASEIGKTQEHSVFVFDEPSIGLHPLDVQVLLGVFQALLHHGATVVVIEHDLDVIKNADYVIDMGTGRRRSGRTDHSQRNAAGNKGKPKQYYRELYLINLVLEVACLSQLARIF